MEHTVQVLAVICFITIGLSHIFQSTIWAKFFISLSENEEIGSFINGFIHFPFGVIIVTFHNVWSGIPMVLTLIGYGLLLKGFINFVFPLIGLKSIKKVSMENTNRFVYGGIIMVGIACLLLFSIFYK